MVLCRPDHRCEGSFSTSTIKECCDHDIDPFGLAYTIPGVEGCQLCPVGKLEVILVTRIICLHFE